MFVKIFLAHFWGIVFSFHIASSQSRLNDKENQITNMTHKIGTKVKRIASDYTGGRIGAVIETDGDRRRVKWTDSPRTWVNISALEDLGSATVFGEWVETPNMKTITAYRVCENEGTGETWHEYKRRA